MKLVIPRSIKTFSKKILVTFLLLNFSFLIFSPAVLAQTQSSSSPIQGNTSIDSPTANNQNPSVNPRPITATPSSNLKDGQVLGIISWTCGILGGVCDVFKNLFEALPKIALNVFWYCVRIAGSMFGSSSKEACEGDPNCQIAMGQVDPFYNASDFIAKVNVFTIADSGFSTMYAEVPKINSATYLADDFNQNIFGVKIAKAQSIGQNTFGEKLKLIWKKFQDLAYIAMVLVLVVIGFMVMLRRRLDPRTVVTATNALPRVVIALILITFSFAISGLFVDFIHISVALVRNYLKDIAEANILGFLNLNFSDASGAWAGELFWLPIFTLISKSVLQIPVIITLLITSSAFVFLGPFGWAAELLVLLAVFSFDLLLRIFMFILAVMLFWNLVQRFVTLVIFTIFSPVFFLFGAVPGYEGVVSTWFRRMASAALCFPILLVFIYIAIALISIGGHVQIQAPPPIGETGKIFNIGVLVGIGILFFAQKVPAFVDEMLGIKPSGGGSGRGGGGVGLGAVIGAPIKGLNMASTLNRAAPVLVGATSGAVARNGLVGRFIASPLRSLGLAASNNQEFDALGNPNRNAFRSNESLRQGTYNVRTAMGTLANEKTDAVSIAKNQWVSDHMATENATRRAAGAKLLTRDEAEADYVGHFAKSHPPAIGPSRSGAQSAAEANEMVENYAQGLRDSGVQEIDIIPKTKAFIKNGFRP